MLAHVHKIYAHVCSVLSGCKGRSAANSLVSQTIRIFPRGAHARCTDRALLQRHGHMDDESDLCSRQLAVLVVDLFAWPLAIIIFSVYPLIAITLACIHNIQSSLASQPYFSAYAHAKVGGGI